MKLKGLDEERLAIFGTHQDLIRGIYWIDKLNKEKLENDILECECNILDIRDHYKYRVQERLQGRHFIFKVKDIEIKSISKMINEIKVEYNMDSMQAFYSWVIIEAKKIFKKAETGNKGNEKINEFGVDYIKSNDVKFKDKIKLIDDLKNYYHTDNSCIKIEDLDFIDLYHPQISYKKMKDAPYFLTVREFDEYVEEFLLNYFTEKHIQSTYNM